MFDVFLALGIVGFAIAAARWPILWLGLWIGVAGVGILLVIDGWGYTREHGGPPMVNLEILIAPIGIGLAIVGGIGTFVTYRRRAQRARRPAPANAPAVLPTAKVHDPR